MTRRPLVVILALIVGDYLLWNWSLNGNHDVLALVSGLTLPPLVLVFVWLAAVNATRLLAVLGRRRRREAPAVATRSRGYATQPAPETSAAHADAEPSSGQIAA